MKKLRKILFSCACALLATSLSIVTATSLAAYLSKGENKISLNFESEAVATKYFDGVDSDGYYKITTPTHLQNLQKLVSLGLFGANDKFILTQDMAWSGDDLAPIGTDDMPFISVFEGNGHKITNLVVDGKDTADIGMFGYVGMEGHLQNFFLDHPTVKVSTNSDGGTSRTTNPMADILDAAAKAITIPTHSASSNTFSSSLPTSITGTDDNTYEITWRSTNENYLYNNNGTWMTKWGGDSDATENVNAQIVGTVYGLVDGEVAAYVVERFQVTITPDGLISDETKTDDSGNGETQIGIFKTIWQQDGNTSQEDHQTYVGLIAGHIDGYADYIGVYGGSGTDINTATNATIIVNGRPAKSSMILVGKSRSDSYLDSGYSRRMRIYTDFTKNVTGLKDASNADYDPVTNDYFKQIHEWENGFLLSRTYDDYSKFSSVEDAENQYESALSQYESDYSAYSKYDLTHDTITYDEIISGTSGSGKTKIYGYGYYSYYVYKNPSNGFITFDTAGTWSYSYIKSEGVWPQLTSVAVAFKNDSPDAEIAKFNFNGNQSLNIVGEQSEYYDANYKVALVSANGVTSWQINTTSSNKNNIAYIKFGFQYAQKEAPVKPDKSDYIFKGDPDDELVRKEYESIHTTAKSITQSFLSATDETNETKGNEDYFRVYPSFNTAYKKDDENYLKLTGPLGAGTYSKYASKDTKSSDLFTWSTVRDFYVENGIWLWPTSESIKVSEDEKFYVTYNITYSAKNSTTDSSSYRSSNNSWRILYNGYNDEEIYTMKYVKESTNFTGATVKDNYDDDDFFLDNKVRSATWWDLSNPKKLETSSSKSEYGFDDWVDDTDNVPYPSALSIEDDGQVHRATISVEMSMLNALAATENSKSSGGYYPMLALGIGANSATLVHTNTKTTTAGTGRQRGYAYYPTKSSSSAPPYNTDKQFFHDYFTMNDKDSFELDIYDIEVIFSNRAGNVAGNVRNCDFLFDICSCINSWDSETKTFKEWNVLSGVKPSFSVSGTDIANYYFWRTESTTSSKVYGRYSNEVYPLNNTSGYASADLGAVT